MTVAADPESLDRYVRIGAASRSHLTESAQRLGRRRDAVAARCGHRAVPSDAFDAIDRLVAMMEGNENMVDGVRRRLLHADTAVAALDGASSAEPPAASPWSDPFSGSWVVNLVRAGTGRAPTVPFLQRVVTEGPAVTGVVGDAFDELGSLNQARLLLSDPGRFIANWARAGDAALDVLAGLAGAGAGLVLGGLPGGGSQAQLVTGQRLDHELAAALLGTVQLLREDPDAVGRSVVGWDELRDDPYRWLGAQAPDVVAELVAGGAAAALRATRLRRGVRLVEPLVPDGPAAGAGADWLAAGRHQPHRSPFPDLDVQRQGEVEWAQAGPIVSHRRGPFESPETWVGDINGGGTGVAGRNRNCVDCARAVEANWRGQDAVAAPVQPSVGRGTGAHLLEDWTGGTLQPTSVTGVGLRLEQMGPGSSALIVSRWGTGRAHAYNAVNDAGVIKWVDGQAGQVSGWPPPYASSVDATLAIFVGPDGTPL